MPTEQLILRRVFPVPVTDADNRRADEIMAAAGEHPMDAAAWHAAIKESTGAIDEVYAVIDGREVRVAVMRNDLGNSASWEYVSDAPSIGARARHLDDLCEKADEDGYWQRPHEVRHVLEEPMMSHKTMARIAGNSIAAGGK